MVLRSWNFKILSLHITWEVQTWVSKSLFICEPKVYITGNRPARLALTSELHFPTERTADLEEDGMSEDKEITSKSTKKYCEFYFHILLWLACCVWKFQRSRHLLCFYFLWNLFQRLGYTALWAVPVKGWWSCTETCQHTLQQSPINNLTLLQVESLHHVPDLYSKLQLLPLNSSLLLPSCWLALSAPVPDLVPICLQLHQFNSINQQKTRKFT